MKKYYIKRGDFANVYSLVYAETEAENAQAIAEGYEQITRKEAEKLCIAERYREKYDAAFSGYADTVILPVSYPANDRDWRDDCYMFLNGYIVERI